MSALDTIVASLFGATPERALPILFLVLARAMPLAWAAPWLGWRGTAGLARVALGLALGLSLAPIAIATAPEVPSDWLALALMAVREALIGVSFAIASSLPLIALGWTGELIDRWRGGSAEGPGPLGALHLASGVVLFFVIGGHRLALSAFAGGLIDAPIGAGSSAEELSSFALGAAHLAMLALELAVAFAAPAAIAFVVVELALGLAARVSPAIGGWLSAMPLRAALGVAIALLALSAVVPRLPSVFASSIEAAERLVRDL